MLGMHRYLVTACAEPIIIQGQESDIGIIYLFWRQKVNFLLLLIRQTRHDDFQTMLKVTVLFLNSDTQHKKYPTRQVNHDEILKKLIDFLNTGGLNSHFMRAEMCPGDFLEPGIAPEKTIFVHLVSNQNKSH